MSFNDFVSSISNMLGPARSSAPPAPAANVGFAPAPRAESAPSPAPTSFTPAPPAGSPGDLPRVSFSGADAWEFLPEPARSKFLALRDECDDLHSSFEPSLREKIDEVRIDLQKAQSRVARIEAETVAQMNGGDLAGLASEREKVARLADEMARLQARYDSRASQWRSKRQVVTALETYLRKAGGPFEMAPAVSAPTPSKGENSLDLLLRLRQKVAKLKEDRQAVLDAPVPAANAKRVAVQQIEALAARGKPNCVSLIDGAREIVWPTRYELAAPIIGADGRPIGFAGRDREQVDVWALFAWLNRDAIVQRVCAEIDAVSDDASALSPESRQKKLAQADAALLAAEREEEAVVMSALAAGFLIDRREDADPRAILGIEGPAPRAAL